ncbi:ABC transporter ATP-binding protein [Neobacillus sp. M.A.Huq-85]|nr:ABC transporter ATP-binding protein [Neobacillus cucumis]
MLSLENVHVSYGPIKAIKGISLQIDEGEMVALIGANGAGKSTTLKAIAGIEPIESGEIRFNGQNISNLPYNKTSNLGITLVPEGRQLFPDMTVKENLEMGYKKSRKGACLLELLEKVYEYFPDVYTKRNELASSLSGGQQQMVAIGRGIMSEPKLLMFDEPSLGLSPVLVQNVVKIIRTLHEKGHSILLVEQNANMALKIANRGYVLEMGRIVLEDQAHSLLKNEEIKAAYLGL